MAAGLRHPILPPPSPDRSSDLSAGCAMSGVIILPAPTQGVSEAYENRLWSAYRELFVLHHERPQMLSQRTLDAVFEAWECAFLALDQREAA